MLDMEDELKTWICGRVEPIETEFRKVEHVDEIYQLLRLAVLD